MKNDSQSVAQRQALLNRELKADQERARRMKNNNRKGLVGGVSKLAVMNAVAKYGPGIMGEEGAEYWRDQRRKYPHIEFGHYGADTGNSPNGHKTRHGKVSMRKVGGVWYRWENGDWVEERKRSVSKCQRVGKCQ